MPMQTTSKYSLKILVFESDAVTLSYKEKSQYDEFQQITIYANNHNLPKIIVDTAIRYHKKISEHKTFRGLNRDGIIAASIYIAARINNYPRTAKEIATIFNLDNIEENSMKPQKFLKIIINTFIFY